MKSLSEKIVDAVNTNDLGYLFKVVGLNKQEINTPVNEDGDNLFMWSIKNRQWPLVERLLQNNMLDENAVNTHNETAVHTLVNMIVSEDIPVDAKKKCGTLLKHFIARKEIKINVQDENGLTPWMIPFDKAMNPYISVEEYQVIDDMESLFLRREDLDINLQNKNTFTGLMLAAFREQYGVVEKFLEKGADANITTEDGYNILMQAADLGDEILADMILKQENLDINAVNNYGSTALINALYQPQDAKKASIAKKIVSRDDVNVNVRDKYGNSPIILAYRNGLKDVFSKLMAKEDIDLNMLGSENENILMLAVENGDAKLVYQILSRPNVDINAFDNAKENVVMKAIKNLEKNGEIGYAILKVLLAHPDLDINAAASENGQGNALTTAILVKNDKVIDMILARKDVDIDRPFNYAAVDTALRSENLSLLYRLTDHKCFDAKDEDFNGSNAIGHFLEKTAQLVTPDKFEIISTDLLDACKQEEIEELLNHRNKLGDNALMTAIKSGATASMINIFLNDVVRHFGLINIDFDAKNNNGESIYDLIETQRTFDKNSNTGKIINAYRAYCKEGGYQKPVEVECEVEIIDTEK